MRPWLESLARDGSALATGQLDASFLADIETALAAGPFARQRGGSTFVMWHVLSASTALTELAGRSPDRTSG